MKTIYTAIFGNVDDLKTPQVISKNWNYICYTDQPLKSKVWKIIKVPLRPEGAQRTARYYKIMFHKHIETKYSMWVDASFVINCDLNEWWKRFKSPMTCIKHPLRDCVYEEGKVCAEQGRGGSVQLANQMINYMDKGLPAKNGLIQSGILMRENCKAVNDLCDLWWHQLSAYSVRDQISFAYASWKKPVHNVIEYNYSTGKDFLFLYHLNSPKRAARIKHYKQLKLLK